MSIDIIREYHLTNDPVDEGLDLVDIRCGLIFGHNQCLRSGQHHSVHVTTVGNYRVGPVSDKRVTHDTGIALCKVIAEQIESFGRQKIRVIKLLRAYGYWVKTRKCNDPTLQSILDQFTIED